MSVVKAEWQGETYEFVLRLAEIRRLENESNAGTEEILTLMRSGMARTNQSILVLSLGLVGAGYCATYSEAERRLEKLLDDRAASLADFKMAAMAVLGTVFFNYEHDSILGNGGQETKKKPTKTRGKESRSQ